MQRLEKKLDHCKAFIRGVPPNTSQDSLKETFSECGDIIGVNMVKDKDYRKTKGIAFITFSNADEVQQAIKRFNGMIVNGSRILVDVALEPLYDQLKSKNLPDLREELAAGRVFDQDRRNHGDNLRGSRGSQRGSRGNWRGSRGGRGSGSDRGRGANGRGGAPMSRGRSESMYDDDYFGPTDVYDDPYKEDYGHYDQHDVDPYDPHYDRDPYDAPSRSDPYFNPSRRHPYSGPSSRRDPYDSPRPPRRQTYDHPPSRRSPFDFPPRRPYDDAARGDPYDIPPRRDPLSAQNTRKPYDKTPFERDTADGIRTYDYDNSSSEAGLLKRPFEKGSIQQLFPKEDNGDYYGKHLAARSGDERDRSVVSAVGDRDAREPYKGPYGAPSTRDLYRDPPPRDPYRAPSNREPYEDPPSGGPYRDPPSRDPYRAPSTRDPYGPPISGDPYRAPPSRDPYGDPPARDPHGDLPARDPYRMRPQDPYGASENSSAIKRNYSASNFEDPYGGAGAGAGNQEPYGYSDQPKRGRGGSDRGRGRSRGRSQPPRGGPFGMSAISRDATYTF